MAKTLIIDQIFRSLSSGDRETLDLKSGVNVIVGPANSGKTTWLRMLDFLMGETDSAATQFDDTIFRKYQSVGARLEVGTKTILVERRWSTEGGKSQFFLNDARFNLDSFQPWLLTELEIPILKYPQGRDFADRTWPTLGWRSLLRHIYRRQEFWGSLVPRQPESEQHACILQFLGIAQYLFADEYASLVDIRRQIARLQTQKDSFMQTVQEISPDLLDDPGLSVGITVQSIHAAQERLRREVVDIVKQRDELLKKLRDGAATPGQQFDILLRRRLDLVRTKESLQKEIESLEKRSHELVQYESSLQQEHERLKRAETAAEVFQGLRITNCPACDQSLDNRPRTASDVCFLCGQAISTLSSDESARRRLKFEFDQVAAELAEAQQLRASLDADLQSRSEERDETESRLHRVENALLPFQSAAAAILPEEVALMDQTIGARNERLGALQRLIAPLQRRDQISSQIDELQSQAGQLEAILAQKQGSAELEVASDRLAEGFNTYLNDLRRLDANSWTKNNSIAVRVGERSTRFLIDSRPAMKQLGGTLMIYFLFAYHYALLNLTRFPDCNYPGLTILDLFPEIVEGISIRDRLRIVLEPFIALSQDRAVTPIQVIATGTDFPKRSEVNRIDLNQIWR